MRTLNFWRGLTVPALLAALVLAPVSPTAPTQPAQASALAGPVVGVADAWARPAPAGMMTAAYLTLSNTGDADDQLLGAATDICDATEVHNTEMQNGVMRMRPAGVLAVPAGATVTFQPGGLHIMLIGLKQELTPGMEFTVTLQLQQAGEVSVPVTVRGG